MENKNNLNNNEESPKLLDDLDDPVVNEKYQLRFTGPMSFVSGLLTGLISASSGFWLKDVGVNPKNITLINIAKLINPFKILWMPLFDIINFTRIAGWFGWKLTHSIQRKASILLTSFLAGISIMACGFCNPGSNLMLFLILITFANFWHISADVIMTAYNIETLRPISMGISTAGFRIGIFFAHSVFTWLHGEIGLSWGSIFIFAGATSFLIIALVMAFSPAEVWSKVKSAGDSFINPFIDLVKKYRWSLLFIMLFLIVYRAQEKILVSMNQYYLRDNAGLSVRQYCIVRFISTFMLVFATTRATEMINSYGYFRSFYFSSWIGIGCVFLYYIHTLNSNIAYIGCILAGLIMFNSIRTVATKSHRMNKLRTGLIILGILSLAFFLKNLNRNGELAFMSILTVLTIDKVVSGIKGSLVYSYRAGICSKDYVLMQISIFEGVEQFFGIWLQVITGRIFAGICDSSWDKFFLLNILIAGLPVVVLMFIPKKSGLIPDKS